MKYTLHDVSYICTLNHSTTYSSTRCTLVRGGVRIIVSGLDVLVGITDDIIDDFEGHREKYVCVFGGFGAGVGGLLNHSAAFCSIVSPPLSSRHTVSPVSGLKALSASGLMRSPFKVVSPFHKVMSV